MNSCRRCLNQVTRSHETTSFHTFSARTGSFLSRFSVDDASFWGIPGINPAAPGYPITVRLTPPKDTHTRISRHEEWVETIRPLVLWAMKRFELEIMAFRFNCISKLLIAQSCTTTSLATKQPLLLANSTLSTWKAKGLA